jgi:crotonobetainyl-CoA:carnitine CoA-transferase CaiB-like acyl-CoA transferase
MASAPLADLLVVETASVLAGPAVGMFFAELGARVVKLENARAGGDVTRKWKLPTEDPAAPLSAYFCSVNWGKEHEHVDLNLLEGRDRLDALLAQADVLITNHMAADAHKLGLEKDRLRERYPRLVHGHIKGFAAQEDRAAYDVVLQAETGFLSMSGTDAEHLAKLPVAVIDVVAAHQLKEGLLLALLQRMHSGRGAYVEVSLEESALATLMNQASNWLMAGHRAQPMATLHPNIAPYGEMFSCADARGLLLAIGSDAQFGMLCQVLQRPHLALDERYRTNALRVVNRKTLAEELNRCIAVWQSKDLLAALHAVGVPAGAVLGVDEALITPIAQRMVLESTMEGTRTQRLCGNVFRIEPYT